MHRLLLALLIFAATSARAQEEPPPNPLLLPPAPTHEEVAHLAGDSDRPVDLVTTLYYPEGPGPFPLAIVNHGANDVQEKPAEVKRHRFTYLAYYFLSRGYAVALPMMRGYGGSSGSQTRHHCDLDEVALDNGRDIAGVIAALTPFVRIDPTRIVVAGQSYGGWNTLGLGALDPPPANVRGLVNFSGGLVSSGCLGGNGAEALVRGAARFGAATTLPSLWFYGENDSLFATQTWQAMYRAYKAQGGQASLVDTGTFMNDSHQLLSHPESFPIWVPRLDAFLARIGMPSRRGAAGLHAGAGAPAHAFRADRRCGRGALGQRGRTRRLPPLSHPPHPARLPGGHHRRLRVRDLGLRSARPRHSGLCQGPPGLPPLRGG